MAPSLHGLTQPVGNTAVLRAVLNQHWRVLVQDFLSLQTLSPLHAETVLEVQRLLKSDPLRVVRVLRQPSVACLVGALRRRKTQREELERELDQLVLTELGVVPGNDGPATRHQIVGSILFATTDNNPLLSVQAHPDRAGNRVDLGGQSVDDWLAALRTAFAIIERYQPLIFEEMKLALSLVVPVGVDAEKHFSVSFEEAVGAIYLTLHPNVMTMAEALIHEFQHNKLNAVFRWDPVLQNAHAPLYSSPVRPDPRPLHGVLMAVHAFQPVAKLYEEMTKVDDLLSKGRDWNKRFRQIIDINHEGAKTVLDNGRPTPVGAGLLDEMRELDTYYAKFEL